MAFGEIWAKFWVVVCSGDLYEAHTCCRHLSNINLNSYDHRVLISFNEHFALLLIYGYFSRCEIFLHVLQVSEAFLCIGIRNEEKKNCKSRQVSVKALILRPSYVCTVVLKIWCWILFFSCCKIASMMILYQVFCNISVVLIQLMCV